MQLPDVARGNQIEIYLLTLFGFLFMPQDKGQRTGRVQAQAYEYLMRPDSFTRFQETTATKPTFITGAKTKATATIAATWLWHIPGLASLHSYFSNLH